MSDTIHISVRELVGFVLRRGSADTSSGFSRMHEGSRLHRLVQKKAGEGYTAEVPLSGSIEHEELSYEITGRADGVIEQGGIVTVDEIKSTTRELHDVDPDLYPEYTAQADLYAWMLARSRGLAAVTVRITFVQVKSAEIEFFESRKSAEELERRVRELLSLYRRWAILIRDSRERLTSSAAALKFPYKNYRDGQSDIILEAYRTLKKKRRLFVEAPTGIGKTLSVCYAAIKALGEGHGKRIFYLTPKSTVGAAPSAAIDTMRAHGLCIRTIILTAKEKCCLCRQALSDCSSIVCEYSFDHYTRVSDAMYALVSENDTITPELTAEYAKKYRVCPYELSLDAAMLCDFIICDCNYLLDPRVYLRRFFGEGADRESIALIDEAHDLVDRAREMYSAELSSASFSLLGGIIPESDFILYHPLRSLLLSLRGLRPLCADNTHFDGDREVGAYLSHKPFEGLSEAAESFAHAAFEWLRVNGEALDGWTLPVPEKKDQLITDEVRDAAWAALRYAKAAEAADKRFLHLVSINGDATAAKLLCMDPSGLLDEKLKKVRAAVLFSATLTPMDYFTDLLGGRDAQTLSLPSPFGRDQLFLGVMDKISMRLCDREHVIDDVIEAIDTTVSARRGNYLVFLPSYAMLKKVALAYSRMAEGVKVIAQKRDMSADERDKFLARFREGGAVVGFAVIGGVFSESIDLTGERLIGTIIVGTGLARLNTESNIIAEYFAETRESGFEYAYQYPAMNKVLQAIGRVIRTETDRGVCILIDDRYATREWARLFPEHLRPLCLVGDSYSLEHALRQFWNKE